MIQNHSAFWDKYKSLSAALSQGISSVSEAWELERLDKYEFDGTGTAIAILDTAIHHACPIKVRAQINCISQDNRNFSTPSVNHGTICAAIAAGSHNFDRIENIVIPRGVAPGAKVDIYRIADDHTFCTNDSVLTALNQIIERMSTCRVDVVSISYKLNKDDENVNSIRDKITELTDMGVVVVAATGNRGLYQSCPAIPACFDNVISVGALDGFGEKSKFNPDVPIDVYAPGELSFPPLDEMYGTSLATPAIGGIVLLLKQLANAIGTPVKENIHKVTVLKSIFKEMTTNSANGLPVFEPIDFLLRCRMYPYLLYEITQRYT